MHVCVYGCRGQRYLLLDVFLNCYYLPLYILRQSLCEPQIWRFSWLASLRDCGGLKENGPQRLIGTGTIRCGLVGVSVVLLEEVCLHLFLLPTDPDVEFSGTLQHQLCLHAAMLLP